jgi:hypothetical protein
VTVDRPSSLVVKLLVDRIDDVTANGVCGGTRSELAATLSHFPELGTKLELLGSRCNAVLTEDQVDALRTQVHPTSDLLASFVPPSAAHGSPDGVGGGGWKVVVVCVILVFSFVLM